MIITGEHKNFFLYVRRSRPDAEEEVKTWEFDVKDPSAPAAIKEILDESKVNNITYNPRTITTKNQKLIEAVVYHEKFRPGFMNNGAIKNAAKQKEASDMFHYLLNHEETDLGDDDFIVPFIALWSENYEAFRKAYYWGQEMDDDDRWVPETCTQWLKGNEADFEKGAEVLARTQNPKNCHNFDRMRVVAALHVAVHLKSASLIQEAHALATRLKITVDISNVIHRALREWHKSSIRYPFNPEGAPSHESCTGAQLIEVLNKYFGLSKLPQDQRIYLQWATKYGPKDKPNDVLVYLCTQMDVVKIATSIQRAKCEGSPPNFLLSEKAVPPEKIDLLATCNPTVLKMSVLASPLKRFGVTYLAETISTLEKMLFRQVSFETPKHNTGGWEKRVKDLLRFYEDVYKRNLSQHYKWEMFRPFTGLKVEGEYKTRIANMDRYDFETGHQLPHQFLQVG